MSGYSTSDKIIHWLLYDRVPVVKLLIISILLTALAFLMLRGLAAVIPGLLAFSSVNIMIMPWTIATYPLVSVCGSIFCLLFTLFACYWLWLAGGSLERTWGSKTFGLFFFAVAAISALGVTLGSAVVGRAVHLVGLTLPLAGITVAWAALNPDQIINFYAVLPVKLRQLAVLTVILVPLSYLKISIVIGVFALAGCAFAQWFATRGTSRRREPKYWRGRRIDDDEDEKVIRLYPRKSMVNLNPLKWYNSYRDKKRLKKLFEKSGYKD